MCGRYASSRRPEDLVEEFEIDRSEVKEALAPDYNVAPTKQVYAVVERPSAEDAEGQAGPERQLRTVKWGLVPFWAKDPAIGNKMINARADGLADKNAYRHAFRKKRCLVPADGFYEWRKTAGEKAKQPFYIHRADGEPLALAGLWEEWRPSKDSDERLRSTTIITTTPNELMATIHDRMPVILPPSAWEAWLDPDNADLETLGKLLVPAPDGLLTMHPVSKDVGNVRNQGAHLIEPIAEAGHLPAAAVHPVAFVLALALVTGLHVVLGEMVPKNATLAGPERAALWLAPALAAIVRIFQPLIWALNAASNLTLRAARVTPRSEVASTVTRARARVTAV